MRARPSAACCCTLLLVVCAAALHDTAPSTASSNARAHQDDVGHRRVRRQNGEVVESIFQVRQTHTAYMLLTKDNARLRITAYAYGQLGGGSSRLLWVGQSSAFCLHPGGL
ncbi:DNA integrity scanning protein DisA [Frankliniella fusca]|uniref:DNA integrity scanning protein DisA n=1 Tax=Frankliniella fusca TaxID=407009 RepID=A0AAE1LP63_9NEOP|nr:DNA integrity scanning protein DisA [Frankliniella fusca]